MRGPEVCGQCGFTTIQFVFATGVALLFLVFASNFIVFQYGRGVVRAALDEGARAGTLSAGSNAERESACHERATAVLDDLLGGPIGREVVVSCAVDGTGPIPVVEARARATFRSWIEPVPDWNFSATVYAIAEEEP